jgi:hypothetical protein
MKTIAAECKINYQLECDNSLAKDIQIDGMKIPSYGLNQDYSCEIYLRANHQLIETVLLHQLAKIRYGYHDYQGVLQGYIQGVQFTGISLNDYRYTISITSPLSRLKLFAHNRVFVRRSFKQIINEVFNKVYPLEILFHGEFDHIQCDMVAQYNQTDYEFLQQFVQQQQIYFCIPTSAKPRIHFFCQLNDLPSTVIELPIVPQSQLIPVKASFYNIHAQSNQYQDSLTVASNDATIELGNCVALEIDNSYKRYRVITISHQGTQGEGAAFAPLTTAIAYETKLTLLPLEQPLCFHGQRISKHQHIHTASIEAKNCETPDINDSGFYQLRFAFDLRDGPKATASTALPLVQHYIGKENLSAGWHFANYDTVKVAAVSFSCDYSQSVILGVIPNACHPSPVASHNIPHSMLASKSKHCFVMHDLESVSYLKLNLNRNKALFSLNNCFGNKGADLKVLGDLALNANKNFYIDGKNYFVIVHRDYQSLVQYDQQTHLLDGKFVWSSANKLALTAKRTIKFFSEAAFECVTMQNQITFQGADIIFQAGQGFRVNISNGKYLLKGKQQLLLTADALSKIIFQNDCSNLICGNGGVLSLKGQQITVDAERINFQHQTSFNTH